MKEIFRSKQFEPYYVDIEIMSEHFSMNKCGEVNHINITDNSVYIASEYDFEFCMSNVYDVEHYVMKGKTVITGKTKNKEEVTISIKER